MRVHPTLVVVAVSLVSLAGWTPLRVAEQALSPLLAPANELVLESLPFDQRRTRIEVVEPLRSEAHDAWLAWRSALLDRPAPAEPGVELFLAPVVGGDRARRELLVKLPPRASLPSTPVTWRGVLIGFLRPWSRNGERVDNEGLAKVALLGHPLARPVAATWQAGPRAAAVHFLLTAGEDGPRVAHRSRPFDPLPGQLAWSRDASLLGDDLPAGLLLGRLIAQEAETDRPGGGLATALVPDGDERVEPLVDPWKLGHVVVELQVGVSLPARRNEARFVSSASASSVRIDSGLFDGVRVGDLVIQDAVLVGVVETAGPTSSVVRVGTTQGMLLLVSADGRIVGATQQADGWPDGWRPELGQPVLGGHRTLGGFRIGTVSAVGSDDFELCPAPFDPRGPVTVVEP